MVSEHVFLEEGIVTNTFEQYVFSKRDNCKAVQFFRVELHIYNCINRSIKQQMHSQNIFSDVAWTEQMISECHLETFFCKCVTCYRLFNKCGSPQSQFAQIVSDSAVIDFLSASPL